MIGSALTYSQVYGDEEVLKVAAITKLSRNLALAGVIPLLAWRDKQQEVAAAGEGAAGEGKALGLKEIVAFFPPFVGGFIAMAALRTVGDASISYGDAGLVFGLMDPEQWKQMTSFVGSNLGGTYCLGTAMAAVGLSTSISSLSGVGIKPFLVGGAASMCVGVTGFTMATILV